MPVAKNRVSPIPGDLVAFSGRDLVSDVINLSTLGVPRWGASHVAIVTRHPSYGICLCESTTLADRPCLERRECVAGVQFQPLWQRVGHYPGRVWHYPLRVPLAAALSAALNHYLLDLVEAECAYDMIGAVRSRTMLYAHIRRLKYGREDLRTLFCSELVAAAWRRYDLMEIANASDWNPNSLIREALRQKVVSKPIRWR